MQGARSARTLRDLHQFFGVGRVGVNSRRDNHREDSHRYVVCDRTDLREVRRSLRDRSTPNPGWTGRDHRDDADDESPKTQTRTGQNPQRPYAGHPADARMKRWSQLHGDMQERQSEEAVVHSQ